MIYLNSDLVTDYKSNSQKARIMTEFWTWENIFCPNCWGKVFHYNNNKPVADFYCKNCNEDYELKSWKSLWNKITDWAYLTMITRLKSSNNPNFFFLNYTLDYKIKNSYDIRIKIDKCQVNKKNNRFRINVMKIRRFMDNFIYKNSMFRFFVTVIK